PNRVQHHRRERVHVRPHHRDCDHRVDDRQRAGGPTPHVGAAPVTAEAAVAVDMPDAITVEGVAKSFGAVTALIDISLRLGQGECLGLIGDNGAGKSTLIKILSGFHRPDRGRILVYGEEASMRSVDDARSLGIDTVYQDLALVPTLSVAHNMFLNREVTRGIGPFRWLDNREMRRRARSYIEAIGI